MFPYSLIIPKNLKQFIPQLNSLIDDHDCDIKSRGKDGITSIILNFKTVKLRNDFVDDLTAQLPAYIGLGKRLVATAEE